MQIKLDLYRQLAKILKSLNINKEHYPLKAVDILKQLPNFIIKYHKFDNTYIGAFLVKREIPNYSCIMINSKKSTTDQNFDIAHELVHYWLHPANNYLSFDKAVPNQIKKFEWQANEGAAQLLVPYQDFIPRFLKTAAFVEENYLSVDNIYTDLAKYYGVNEVVIDYRIQNLDSEILQHARGVSINKLTLIDNDNILDKTKKVSINKKFLEKLKRREVSGEYKPYNGE